MSEQMPPPGPERDAEIAKLLGWDHRHEFGIDHSFMAWCGEYLCLWCGKRDTGEDKAPTRCSGPSWSTDPAACDRLVEEMVRRGWTIETRSSEAGTNAACWCEERVVRQAAHAPDRPAAVSAAALLALRGGK